MAAKQLGCLLIAMLLATGALREPAHAQPAPSSWPMMGQNVQRTGESPYEGPLTDNLKWVIPVGMTNVAIGRDALYTDASGSFCSINFDGSRRWYLPFPTPNSYPAVDQNEVVYVGSDQGGFYAIDANQPGAYVDGASVLVGGVKWMYPTASGVGGYPLIDDRGAIYVVLDGALCKLSIDGILNWRRPFSGGARNPAIGHDGTIYVCPGSEKVLYAIDSTDAAVKWKTRLKGVGGEPVVGDPARGGAVYVLSADWIFYAIDPLTGSILWNISLSKKPNIPVIWFRRPVVDNASQTVYLSGPYDFLAFGFDGKLKWTLPDTGGHTTKAAMGKDGLLYVPMGRSTLAMVSPSGEILWSRDLGFPWFYPVIDRDGTLFVGGSALHAFQDGAAPRPGIYYTRAIPNPALTGESIRMWASRIATPCPDREIEAVAFYEDCDFDSQLDPDDMFLGSGVLNPEYANWFLDLPSGLAEGIHMIFAQAIDTEGTLSNVVSTVVVVDAAAP